MPVPSSLKIFTVFVALLAIGGVGLYLVDIGTAEVPEDTIPLAEAVTPTSTASSITTSSIMTTSTTMTSTPAKGTLVIQGTGDVNLDPTYIPALATNGYGHAWEGLEGIFLADDLTVINLECAPSGIGAAEPKEFVFRCPPESLVSLAPAGIDVASLGNNHSGDYGKRALIDSRDNLIAAGVLPVGAGKDATEAGAPALSQIEGWNVAVLGFGGVFPTPAWFATDDRAGMRDGDDITSMVAAVSAADAAADLVVVTVRWGAEFDTEPRTDDIERARAIIAAGADVIFGHHAHRLQPLEMVNDAAVFWGLGNFVWPRHSTAAATTAIGRVVVSPDGSIEACLIPAFIESPGQPVLTGGPSCGPER